MVRYFEKTLPYTPITVFFINNNNNNNNNNNLNTTMIFVITTAKLVRGVIPVITTRKSKSPRTRNVAAITA